MARPRPEPWLRRRAARPTRRPARCLHPDTVAVSARLDYGTRGTVLAVANLRITGGAPGYIGTVEFSSPTSGITEGTATVAWTLPIPQTPTATSSSESGSMTYVSRSPTARRSPSRPRSASPRNQGLRHRILVPHRPERHGRCFRGATTSCSATRRPRWTFIAPKAPPARTRCPATLRSPWRSPRTAHRRAIRCTRAQARRSRAATPAPAATSSRAGRSRANRVAIVNGP